MSAAASRASTLLKQGLPSVLTSSGNPHLPVAGWLFGCTGMVAGIVHVGGVTRLTKSGLSMTDWKPLGSRPPISTEEWEAEFDRYKRFPEFAQRRGMTLDEFKYIYFWEWGHRMLGRAVGVCFAVPWAYFSVRGRIPSGMQPRLASLFALGGTQGLVGWWMVRSGLGEDRRGDRKEIRVSPYRLAAHLCVAATTFSLLGKTALDVLHRDSRRSVETLVDALRASPEHRALLARASRVRAGAAVVTGLTGLTLASGAFVAGNDAGRAYNTFPRMGHDDEWLPWDDLVDETLAPAWRNLFENTALVQANHRALGVTTALSAVALAASALRPSVRAALTPQASRGLRAVGGVAAAQASLGVATLLSHVPIELAALHQVGSLVLLSGGVWTMHALRYARPRLAREALQRTTATPVPAFR